jgi:DNA-binding cell septation regulator SpoVG
MIINQFKKIRKKSLIGFAQVLMPSGIIVHDVMILEGKYGPWARAPGKPRVDKDGQPVFDAKGYQVQDPIVSFKDKETAGAWSNAVIEALKLSHPDAFE